ncbi:MAG: hypothetical protein ACOCT0_06125 [Halobacteriota archaeon]
MEVFEHGGYLVLDGTRASLEHVADLLESRADDESLEVAGKIRRGVDSGATRIAVEAPRFQVVEEALEGDETELGRVLLEDVRDALSRMSSGDTEGNGGDGNRSGEG